MYEITMDLVADWVNTVKEVLRGSGYPLEDGLPNEEIALRYFLHSQPEERAQELATDTLGKLREMEEIIISHMDSTIVPDIRMRTKYQGNAFHFSWVYNQGEHIIELNSEYRIPL
ncbi:hypothetical protein D3P08_02125 [Paenibacillus nanensis]|uniref:Uncharacterized protein n=1 Tax=Paenibacillus nanensis TaxID=393251 RepID=A0A3A1VPB4_9BACL|nr:hypothetical protein [Paenibacillus nanensis]RIX60383.1 hypothetical protein D3P08_02125 [Paenibacillus nanensis]